MLHLNDLSFIPCLCRSARRREAAEPSLVTRYNDEIELPDKTTILNSCNSSFTRCYRSARRWGGLALALFTYESEAFGLSGKIIRLSLNSISCL